MAERICVIDAGGTIAQVRAAGRLRYEDRTAEALKFLNPSERSILEHLGVVEAVHLFSMDSTLMQPEQWTAIASAIKETGGRFDAFVVTHGTDSLAYTASALSWLLGPIGQPVVLTGAQIPLRDEAAMGRSDSWSNLLNAVRVARAAKIHEVAVVFGSRVLRGNRTTKSNVFGLDAFSSPNYPELATVGIDIAYAPGYLPPRYSPRCGQIPERWPRVAAFKAFPGLEPRLMEAMLSSGLDGCVVEVFPSGSLPPELTAVLHAAGLPCLLCLPGSVGIGDTFRYEPGYWIEGNLLVSARDMTREAAIAKLVWSLGVARGDEALDLLRSDLAGEMQAGKTRYHEDEPKGRAHSPRREP